MEDKKTYTEEYEFCACGSFFPILHVERDSKTGEILTAKINDTHNNTYHIDEWFAYELLAEYDIWNAELSCKILDHI